MGQYCIKDEYTHLTTNETLEEVPGSYWTPKRILSSRYYQYGVYRYAADLVKKNGLQTVLDVGCGLPTKLNELLAPIARVTGVDQPTIIPKAKEVCPGAEFYGVDIEKEGQPPNGKFDLVLSVDVIEHLLNPDILLKYIKDHSHGDSWIVISTPERDLLRGVDNCRSPRSEHVREWNADELKRYLEASGLEVVDQQILPAFRVGCSMTMLKEFLRCKRKGIEYRHCQMAVCRLKR